MIVVKHSLFSSLGPRLSGLACYLGHFRSVLSLYQVFTTCIASEGFRMRHLCVFLHDGHTHLEDVLVSDFSRYMQVSKDIGAFHCW